MVHQRALQTAAAFLFILPPTQMALTLRDCKSMLKYKETTGSGLLGKLSKDGAWKALSRRVQ